MSRNLRNAALTELMWIFPGSIKALPSTSMKFIDRSVQYSSNLSTGT